LICLVNVSDMLGEEPWVMMTILIHGGVTHISFDLMRTTLPYTFSMDII